MLTVVVGVAGGGPGGRAVDFAVGDGDAVAGAVAEDNVLAGDEVCGDMVDPDKVGWVVIVSSVALARID